MGTVGRWISDTTVFATLGGSVEETGMLAEERAAIGRDVGVTIIVDAGWTMRAVEVELGIVTIVSLAGGGGDNEICRVCDTSSSTISFWDGCFWLSPRTWKPRDCRISFSS